MWIIHIVTCCCLLLHAATMKIMHWCHDWNYYNNHTTHWVIHELAFFSQWTQEDFQFWGTWLLLFDWYETYWQHAGFIILQRRRRWGNIVSKLTFSISWWMKSIPSFYVTFHLPFVLLRNLFSFSLIHLFCPFLDLIALNI